MADAVNSHRVENTRVSQPESGIMMISAIKYAVCTQLISSCAADNPPPMSCKDEATIWISSNAMNIPMHITTKGKMSFTLSGGWAAVLIDQPFRQHACLLWP